MEVTHLGKMSPDPVHDANRRRAAVLMLLAAAFFWGSGNVANKTVLQDICPFTAVAARNLVAVAVLLPFALRERRCMPNPCLWANSAMLPSALFGVAIILQQWGYQTATVTNASFLVNTACVLTPILAYAALRERINLCIGVAAGLTMLGVFLMSGAGQFAFRLNIGDLACLGSALFYAGWMVALSRHAIIHGCPMATIALHCALTLLFAFGFLMVTAPQQPGTMVGALPEVLYLGVVSTALAFGLTAVAQARVSASCAAVLVAAESLFGAAGGILLLGERPGPQVVFGAALMLVAIFIVARRPAQPADAPESINATGKGGFHDHARHDK